MDWNALKVFLAISKQGSLAGAARVLEVNHSTVFRRLKTLEDSLGGTLFNRINNHYEPTPLGVELLAKAQAIETSVFEIERYIVGKEFQPKGCVKVTAPPNITYRYLPSILANFKKAYPDIEVELLVSNSNVNMSTRQADIAIRATPNPPEYLIGRQVSTLNWSLFASHDYVEKTQPLTAFDDLHQHDLISATGELQHLPAFQWIESNYKASIEVRADDLTAMASLAQTGHGLAALPEDQHSKHLVKLIPLPHVAPSQLWVLTHPDLRNTQRIKLLMNHFVTALSAQWPNT